jgi:predicted transcriptional regulator YdeE
MNRSGLFYGISYFNKEGNIVYKAAATTSSEEEAKKFGLEYFVIPKGQYLSETLVNWMDQLPNIGNTFSAMMKDERADSTFPCVEWYKSDHEMMCMMRTKQQELKPVVM